LVGEKANGLGPKETTGRGNHPTKGINKIPKKSPKERAGWFKRGGSPKLSGNFKKRPSRKKGIQPVTLIGQRIV